MSGESGRGGDSEGGGSEQEWRHNVQEGSEGGGKVHPAQAGGPGGLLREVLLHAATPVHDPYQPRRGLWRHNVTFK